MTNINIPIHSFVDLITNSSSELFVCDTSGTIRAAKDIVNYLLKFGGSDKTAEDLFSFELVIPSGTNVYSLINEFCEEVNKDWDDIERLVKDKEKFFEITDISPKKLELYYELLTNCLVDGVISEETTKAIPKESKLGQWVMDRFMDSDIGAVAIDMEVTAKVDDPLVKEIAHKLSTITGTVNAVESYR